MDAQCWSTGISTEPDTHGPEAALRALTPIREDRTQQGKCCVFSSSIRCQRSKAAFVGGRLAVSLLALSDRAGDRSNVRCREDRRKALSRNHSIYSAGFSSRSSSGFSYKTAFNKERCTSIFPL